MTTYMVFQVGVSLVRIDRVTLVDGTCCTNIGGESTLLSSKSEVFWLF